MKKRLEGNYLNQSRINLFLSKDCHSYMRELAIHEGLKLGPVVEVAIREMWEKRFGPRPRKEIPDQIRRVQG
jgi:hypothetical protein